MAKVFVSNVFVEKSPLKIEDVNFIYFKRLPYVLRKVLPYYFDRGLVILDVTTGKKKMWDHSLFDNETLDSREPFCKVIFIDGSTESDADMLADFRKIPLPDNSVDLIIFDPAFTEIKNAQENHGVKKIKGSGYSIVKGRREFYFRGIGGKWIPPEAYFFQTWREFNRVSRNGLLVKISERFKNLEEVPVLTYLDLAYNKRFNKKSEFVRIVNIMYRGKRKATGARTANAQRVASNYVLFKKNRRKR